MFSIGTRTAETVSPSTRDILSDLPRRQVETDKGGWSETIRERQLLVAVVMVSFRGVPNDPLQ